jgi:cobalt-zinc-cadmium efflux system protein
MNPSSSTSSSRSLIFALILNAAFTVVELVFSILTGSLALIADTANKLTNVFTLSITFIADRVAVRKADTSRSFGYGRATILAALLNSAAMLAVAAFTVFKAIERLTASPRPIEGGLVALVALASVIVDGSITYVLSRHRDDLNIRSAFIDKALDTISSVAAVASGLVIHFTGFVAADSITGIVIALMLVYGAYSVSREAVHILLEGTPRDVDLDKLAQAITDIELVLRVDDIHVWAIRSGANSLTCHVVIHEKHLKHSRKIVEQVKRIVRRDFKIRHATVEVEFESDTKAAGHTLY